MPEVHQIVSLQHCTSPGSAKIVLCHHVLSGMQEKGQLCFTGNKCVCWHLIPKKCCKSA